MEMAGSRHLYFLWKNTERALGGHIKDLLFTAQRNGYFVIQNESNFKACKGQKQPLAKQEEEADRNYTSPREATLTQTALVNSHLQRVNHKPSQGLMDEKGSLTPGTGRDQRGWADAVSLYLLLFFELLVNVTVGCFGINLTWDQIVSSHFRCRLGQVRHCRY